jgi:hypothetical protein
MATFPTLINFTAGTPALAAEVNSNFDDTQSFIETNLIQKDGSLAMTSELTLSGSPTTGLSAATKTYVDAPHTETLYSLGPGPNLSTPTAGTWGDIPTSGPGSLAFTKRRADTNIIVSLSHACFAFSVPMAVLIGITYDAGVTTTELSRVGYNSAYSHQRQAGVGRKFTGLAAGAYTFQPRWQATTSAGITNGNDSVCLSVTEIGA